MLIEHVDVVQTAPRIFNLLSRCRRSFAVSFVVQHHAILFQLNGLKAAQAVVALDHVDPNTNMSSWPSVLLDEGPGASLADRVFRAQILLEDDFDSAFSVRMHAYKYDSSTTSSSSNYTNTTTTSSLLLELLMLLAHSSPLRCYRLIDTRTKELMTCLLQFIAPSGSAVNGRREAPDLWSYVQQRVSPGDAFEAAMRDRLLGRSTTKRTTCTKDGQSNALADTWPALRQSELGQEQAVLATSTATCVLSLESNIRLNTMQGRLQDAFALALHSLGDVEYMCQILQKLEKMTSEVEVGGTVPRASLTLPLERKRSTTTTSNMGSGTEDDLDVRTHDQVLASSSSPAATSCSSDIYFEKPYADFLRFLCHTNVEHLAEGALCASVGRLPKGLYPDFRRRVLEILPVTLLSRGGDDRESESCLGEHGEKNSKQQQKMKELQDSALSLLPGVGGGDVTTDLVFENIMNMPSSTSSSEMIGTSQSLSCSSSSGTLKEQDKASPRVEEDLETEARASFSPGLLLDSFCTDLEREMAQLKTEVASARNETRSLRQKLLALNRKCAKTGLLLLVEDEEQKKYTPGSLLRLPLFEEDAGKVSGP
ncbi:unnamed protein product [Amoebophrya sp. A25]|nr:unnamed protein product [Amoebophrya sp. A25]|eukprot:GSA25T00007358001.1